MHVKFYADSLENLKYWTRTRVDKVEELSSGLMTLPKAMVRSTRPRSLGK